MYTEPKQCEYPGCTSSFKPHYWGSVKAHEEGWFLQKNGVAWCPEHVPEWVEAWRARKRFDGEELI